mmetsp:Transcript_6680/g.12050  ORF Transcript_6680/g.12050 Transcript_6680/m.12050 type:complete len:203 (+) Transcript_6680:107-715(+)
METEIVPWSTILRSVRRYEWGQRFRDSKVMVFNQLFRGEGFGRAMVRSKILHPVNDVRRQNADIRFLVPELARQVLDRHPRKDLREMMYPVFSAAPFVVVFGNNLSRVFEVQTKVGEIYPHMSLVCMKLGDDVLTSKAAAELMKGPKQEELQLDIVQALSHRPELVDLLDKQASGLRSLIDDSNMRLITRIEQSESTKAESS